MPVTKAQVKTIALCFPGALEKPSYGKPVLLYREEVLHPRCATRTIPLCMIVGAIDAARFLMLETGSRTPISSPITTRTIPSCWCASPKIDARRIEGHAGAPLATDRAEEAGEGDVLQPSGCGGGGAREARDGGPGGETRKQKEIVRRSRTPPPSLLPRTPSRREIIRARRKRARRLDLARAALRQIRCNVRRCMLSRRAVSETLWPHSS